MAKVFGTRFPGDDLEDESDFVPLLPGEYAPLQGAGLMSEIVLKEVTRLADKYLTLSVADGKEGVELTEQEYTALALKGAGAPPGVSKEDWESNKVCAAGGVRNYGNGKRTLKLGEYAELADRFELGGITRTIGLAKITRTLEILKNKVTASTVTGLTITKTQADAWPEDTNIASITNGILTTE